MQLLKMLDDGQAVDISGLEDKNISSYLLELFRALDLHRSSEGLFLLPEKASQKIMDVLGHIFDDKSSFLGTEHSLLQGEDKGEESKDDYEKPEHVVKKTGLTGREAQVDEEIPQKRRWVCYGHCMNSPRLYFILHWRFL
jgi:hypothetical protein